ncbi:MAG: hypothetical protein AB7E47_07720 [Desulfovibrionaceae bacterium]
MEQGKKAYLIIYAILCVLISIVAVFCNTNVHAGLFMKLVGVAAASGLGFVGFLIADLLRRLAAPDIIFTTGGFFGLLKQRLFWMCGPQLIGIVIGVIIGGGLVLNVGDASRKTQPKGQASELMERQSPPATAGNSPDRIATDLDAQVTTFLRPPSPDRTIGDWTVIGPVRGRDGMCIRIATDDCMESNSRMGCNLLVLDYTESIPSICIGVGIVSSLEEVTAEYPDKVRYNILVDGQQVGWIRFQATPSPQKEHLLLEQFDGDNLAMAYRRMQKGKRVNFVRDGGDEHFDFDIKGLSELETRL